MRLTNEQKRSLYNFLEMLTVEQVRDSAELQTFLLAINETYNNGFVCPNESFFVSGWTKTSFGVKTFLGDGSTTEAPEILEFNKEISNLANYNLITKWSKK